MRSTGSIFRFFIYSNLFIAACVVLMTHQSFHYMMQVKPNTDYLFFVFFSTLCSYSFHWYLSFETTLPTARTIWLDNYRIVHIIFFIAGLTGALVFFFRLIPYWHWLAISAFVTFLYSAPKISLPLFQSLRKFAIGKTIFLALVWTHVTTILPVMVSALPWKNDFLLFIGSRFFLVFSICILFDYRDRSDDKKAGIRSLITYLNDRGITYLYYFSLLAFGTFTLCQLRTGNDWLQILILLMPGFFMAAIYPYARKHFDDLLYYFILDGMMAFSAIIMLVPGI